MNTPVLNVQGISKRFGGLQALSDVGMTIQRGQVYGLIGPNGAGKTTFFNVITGLYTPDSGSFELAGKPYQPTAVHEVAKAGIARTFQNIRLFAEMTALENVMVGRHVRTGSGLLGAIFRSKAFVAEEKAIEQRAHELLAYVGIADLADYKARTLSYGDQRRLEIARALATDPQLIALDEPAAFCIRKTFRISASARLVLTVSLNSLNNGFAPISSASCSQRYKVARLIPA
jgi:branched-chain amino acid transport system ATP-binding protein